MVLHNSEWQTRLHTARRVLSLIPIVVFLLALMLFARPDEYSSVQFLQLLLRVTAASLAASVVSVAAYGFYRYLLDRSPGL